MFAPQPATAAPNQADIEQQPHTIQTSPISGLRRSSRVRPEGRVGIHQRSNRHNEMSSRHNSRHPVTHLSSVATTTPPETPPPSIPPPPPPSARGRPRNTELRRPRPDSQALSPRDTETLKLSFPLSFEEPRRAPQPPKRPPRPPSELFLPPAPSIATKHGGSGAGSQKFESSQQVQIPPIPKRSPLRHVRLQQKDGGSYPMSPAPLLSEEMHLRGLAPQDEVFGMPGQNPERASNKSSLPSSSPFKPGSPFRSSPSHQSYSPSKLSLRTKEAPAPPLLFQPATKSPEVAFSLALEDMKIKARQGSAWSDSSDELPVRPPVVRSNTAPPSLLATGSTSGMQAARSALLSGSGHQAKSMRARKSSTSPRSASSPLLKAWNRNRSSYQPGRAGEVHAALQQLEKTGKPKKHMRKDAITKQERPSTFTQAQSGGKKRRKGESTSMLANEGFLPVAELVYGNAKKRNNKPPSDNGFRLKLPPRLSFIDKDLPRTPNSAQSTPIELYQIEHDFPTRPRNKTRNRRSGGVQRSPLSLVTDSDTNARSEARNGRKSDQLSIVGLAAIPEDGAGAENSRPDSSAATPVATQIHLRGGSIVTVIPPELTAWKPTVYIHGPIQLPKPAIMPRKNSVASLEPFQEAVDNVYQNALSIPRRRSDDAVVDDICDFFDDFGFEFVSFGGDRLSFMVDGDMGEEKEAVAEAIERFSTPPAEQPGATPVEVVTAKEVLETTSNSPLAGPRTVAPPVIAPPVETEETLRAKGIARLSRTSPPVETEETLRARGIARLSRTSAGSSSSEKEKLTKGKESLTLGPLETSAGLPLLPAPDESMLDAVLEAPSRPGIRDSTSYTDGVHRQRTAGRGRGYGPSVSSNRLGREGSVAYAASMHSSPSGGGCSGGSIRSNHRDQGGFDWDDDVAELDAESTWVAPVGAPKKPVTRGLSTRKTRNPVTKARRLFASAYR